jgi:hypothetical protein
MNVYAPTDESLVLYAGRDKQSSLRTILRRLVGAVGTLVPVSIGVGWFAGRDGGEARSGLESGLSDDPSRADQSGDETATEAESGESSGDDAGAAGDASDTDNSDLGIQTEDAEQETSASDIADLSEISDFEALSTTVEGKIDISSDQLLIEAGNQSVNTTARLQSSANETALTVNPADLASLTTQSSGADPVVAGLAFFLGGLFITTVATVWSVWR